jgi:hypothetical protein
VENREEAARVRIMVLERQCQKKDEDLECLKDEIAYMNPPKKRKEAPTESQILRHKLEALQGRLAEVLGENERLKEKTYEQAQLVELLQGDLYDKHYQAEDICIKIRSLEIKAEKIASQLAEKDELIATWKMRFEHERKQKRMSMKECDDMENYVHYHGVNIMKLLGNATDAMNANRGVIPMAVFQFVRYCEHLIDHLGVQGITE